MNKELKSAVKSGNKHKVARLKEAISSLEGEEKFYEDKRGRHDRELDTLQKKHKEVDKKIYATGITQLPAIDERSNIQIPYSNIIMYCNAFNSCKVES